MNVILADERHDEGIRNLLRRMPMPGPVEIAYTREPSFFAGLSIMGRVSQVVVAEDDGRVVATGSRSIRRVYVNGTAQDFGYLAGLRLLPSVRRGTLLARGYRYLRRLHADGAVPAYLTTIVEHNDAAVRLLTSGRAGLPAYIDHGRCLTHAIPCTPGKARPGRHGLRVLSGEDVPWEDLVRFVNREGARRQFYPVLEASDLGTTRLRGLRPIDFAVAVAGDEIVGSAGLWDQSAFRQNVVCGYHGPLRTARPLLNAARRILCRPRLPGVGESLRMACIAFMAIKDDNPRVLAAILDYLRRTPSVDFVVGAVHERDPLAAALVPLSRHRYNSRLYVVTWEDGRGFCNALDNQMIPHLEPATL